MNRQLDEIDKRIIYRLTQNARDTSAPEIAEEEGVSPATIRNRIKKLEEDGIILGYHAEVAYEEIESRLVNLFRCSSEVKNRNKFAREALQVSGVIHVREIMSGGKDLHVKAVGKDTEELNRIANDLVDLGLEIRGEDLVKREYFHPYHDFGPEEDEARSLLDFRSIPGPAEIATVRVKEESQVSGKNVETISKSGLIGDGVLLISVERGDKTIVPRGKTTIKTGDIVSVFSATGIGDATLDAFKGP